MSERITIDQLKPGMVITQITRQNGPVKIRKSGLVSSDAMVQGLAEMGVQEVEIDPEQTVEIATTVTHRTQTQALLRGQHDTKASAEHAISDQFNRSLFLPTVQSLPSVWKLYLRQVLLFGLVILGGLSIGFTVATYSLWWPAENPVVASQPLPVSEAPATKPEPNAMPASGSENVTNVTPEPAKDDAPTLQEKSDNAGASSETQEQSLANETTNTDEADAESTGDITEGKVLNQPQASDVAVSADLLARFNKAVEALDSEAQTPDDTQPRVKVHDNLPRVDQLPVRVLTRLPTMNFSAHMYASKPRDRWVTVNGVQLGEGDWIDERVQIVSIDPQHVVLGFEEELFTMAALTDW